VRTGTRTGARTIQGGRCPGLRRVPSSGARPGWATPLVFIKRGNWLGVAQPSPASRQRAVLRASATSPTAPCTVEVFIKKTVTSKNSKLANCCAKRTRNEQVMAGVPDEPQPRDGGGDGGCSARGGACIGRRIATSCGDGITGWDGCVVARRLERTDAGKLLRTIDATASCRGGAVSSNSIGREATLYHRVVGGYALCPGGQRATTTRNPSARRRDARHALVTNDLNNSRHVKSKLSSDTSQTIISARETARQKKPSKPRISFVSNLNSPGTLLGAGRPQCSQPDTPRCRVVWCPRPRTAAGSSTARMDARPATSRRPDVFATSPPSSPDILIAMADFSKVAHEVTSVVIGQNKPIPCKHH